MAGLAAIALAAGTAVTAVGTIAAGQAAARQQILAGQAQQAASEFQAKQLEVRAANERAAAQRQAQEVRRQQRLALSRNQAVAAAGGFSTDDPGTLDIQGQIERYGDYQAAIAQYGGDAASDADKASAAGLRAGGANALALGYDAAASTRTNSLLSAAGTIIGGATTMYQKYGMKFAPSIGGSLVGGGGVSGYAYG
jgi:hypothetical protein